MKKTVIGLLILLLLSTQIGCNKNIVPVELPASGNQPPGNVVSTKEIPAPWAVGPAVQSIPTIIVPAATPPPPLGPISPPVVVVPVCPSTKITPRLSLQIVASEDDITAYFDGSWRLWKDSLAMIEEAGGGLDT